FGSDVDGLIDVLLRLGNILLVDLSDCAKCIAIRSQGLRLDDGGSNLVESAPVVFADGNGRQCTLSFHQVSPHTTGLAPLRFGARQVALLIESHPQVIVRDAIIGITPEGRLQSAYGILEMSVPQLDLSPIDQGFIVLRAGFQNLVIQLPSVVQAILQN